MYPFLSKASFMASVTWNSCSQRNSLQEELWVQMNSEVLLRQCLYIAISKCFNITFGYFSVSIRLFQLSLSTKLQPFLNEEMIKSFGAWVCA